MKRKMVGLANVTMKCAIIDGKISVKLDATGQKKLDYRYIKDDWIECMSMDGTMHQKRKFELVDGKTPNVITT